MDPKQIKQLKIKGVLLFLSIFFAGALFNVVFLPFSARLTGQILVTIFGVAAYAFFIVRKTARSVEDRVLGYSVFSIVPPFLVEFLFLFQLRQDEAVRLWAENQSVTFVFSMFVLTPLVIGSLTYETLAYHYLPPRRFKLKRLGGRILIAFIFIGSLLVIYNLTYLFVYPRISSVHILLLSGTLNAVIYGILLFRIPRIRHMVNRLEKGI